jgi:hypothetical protein
MSGTTSCSPRTEPGAPSAMPVLIWIEQPDPGGVSCTKRTSSLGASSKSTWKPTWSA